MAKIDDWYQHIVNDVLSTGETRNTRSGEVVSVFDPEPLWRHDISRDGFPLLTCKFVPLRLVVGELLWFLSGKTDLKSLRHYSNIPEGGNTIWTADFERYRNKFTYPGILDYLDKTENLGDIYGAQWRDFGDHTSECFGTIDQIKDLIETIKTDPTSRYQMVTAYNPVVTKEGDAALPPCHTFFQTYVDNSDCLHLKWYQRSADMFLGLPFNVASYAMLLKILCKLTNKYEGTLSGTFGDVHIYTNHMEAVDTVLKNDSFKAPKIIMPEFNTLEELLQLTAADFVVEEYEHAGVVKAPLSVG